MLLYTYAFSSDTLVKVTKNVVAISLVVSSVDIKAMDDATIGATVEYCYGSATEEVQQRIVDKLIAIRDKSGHGKGSAGHGSSLLEAEEWEVRRAFEEVMQSEGGLLRSGMGQ